MSLIEGHTSCLLGGRRNKSNSQVSKLFNITSDSLASLCTVVRIMPCGEGSLVTEPSSHEQPDNPQPSIHLWQKRHVCALTYCLVSQLSKQAFNSVRRNETPFPEALKTLSVHEVSVQEVVCASPNVGCPQQLWREKFKVKVLATVALFEGREGKGQCQASWMTTLALCLMSPLQTHLYNQCYHL